MLDEEDNSMNLFGLAWRAAKLGWRRRRFVGFWRAGLRLGDDLVYISCAELIRIRWRGKYLLVPNSRRNQMQPPGGVVQLNSTGRDFLNKIRARQSSPYGAPDKDRNDLRLHVPGKNLLRFIDWYVRGNGREASAAMREYREELLEQGILPGALFESPCLSRAHLSVVGLRKSKVFGGPELLIHQFFDLVDLAKGQEAHLDKLQQEECCGARVGPEARFGWYTAEEIKTGGHFPGSEKQHWSIGEHAEWML